MQNRLAAPMKGSEAKHGAPSAKGGNLDRVRAFIRHSVLRRPLEKAPEPKPPERKPKPFVPDEPAKAVGAVAESELAGNRAEVIEKIESIVEKAEAGGVGSESARTALFGILAEFRQGSEPFEEALADIKTALAFGTLDGEMLQELIDFKEGVLKGDAGKALAVGAVADFFTKVICAEPDELYGMYLGHAAIGKREEAHACITELGKRAGRDSCKSSRGYLLRMVEGEYPGEFFGHALSQLVRAAPKHDVYRTDVVRILKAGRAKGAGFVVVKSGGAKFRIGCRTFDEARSVAASLTNNKVIQDALSRLPSDSRKVEYMERKRTGNSIVEGLGKILAKNTHPAERRALAGMVRVLEGLGENGVLAKRDFELMAEHASVVLKTLGEESEAAHKIRDGLDAFEGREVFSLASWRVLKMAASLRRLAGESGFSTRRALRKIAAELERAGRDGKDRVFSRGERASLVHRLAKLEKDERVGVKIKKERKVLERMRGREFFAFEKHDAVSGTRRYVKEELVEAVRKAYGELGAREDSYLKWSLRNAIDRIELDEQARKHWNEQEAERALYDARRNAREIESLANALFEVNMRDARVARFRERYEGFLVHYGVREVRNEVFELAKGMAELGVPELFNKFMAAVEERAKSAAIAAIAALAWKREDGLPALVGIARGFDQLYSRLALAAIAENSTGRTIDSILGMRTLEALRMSCERSGAGDDVLVAALLAAEKRLAGKVAGGWKVEEWMLREYGLLERLGKYADFTLTLRLIQEKLWAQQDAETREGLVASVFADEGLAQRFREFARLVGFREDDVLGAAAWLAAHPKSGLALLSKPPKPVRVEFAGEKIDFTKPKGGSGEAGSEVDEFAEMALGMP